LTVPTLGALVLQWRTLADILKAEGCLDVASARERCAAELETCLHIIDSQALSVEQAAGESGYSAEHLRRLLRDKPALNAGRRGKPLIRRSDLPRKATIKVVESGPLMYDVDADARFLCGSATRNSQ
jgi:hypothetical protein